MEYYSKFQLPGLPSYILFDGDYEEWVERMDQVITWPARADDNTTLYWFV